MISTPRSVEHDLGSADERHAAAGAGLNFIPADDESRLADLAVRVETTTPPPAAGNPGEPPAPGFAVGTLQVTFGSPHGARLEPTGTLPAGTVRCEAGPQASDGSHELPAMDLLARSEAAVWSAIAHGASVVLIEGGPAAGTTTLFTVLAAGARENGFAGGALSSSYARGPAADVVQRLAAALDPEPPPRYRTGSEVTAVAAGRRVLVLLRLARLGETDMAELTRAFPGFCFVVDNALSLPHTPTVELGPLDAAATLSLLEASCGRSLDSDERGFALDLCASAGSLPGTIRLVGVAARNLRRSFASLSQQLRSGDDIVRALIASRPPLEVRILDLLALARAPLAAHHIAYILGNGTILRNGVIDTALRNLASSELIRTGEWRTYEVSRYVGALVPAPADARELLARIVAVLSDVIESGPVGPVLDRQLAAAEMHLEAMSQHSAWPEVLGLGPQLAQAFAIRGAFVAWGRVLREVEAAAARTGDTHAYALARHDLGVRAVLRGNPAEAQAYLRAAIADRRVVGDEGGALASAAVLLLVDPGSPQSALPAPTPQTSPAAAAAHDDSQSPSVDQSSVKLFGRRFPSPELAARLRRLGLGDIRPPQFGPPQFRLPANRARVFDALRIRLSAVRLPMSKRIAFAVIALWLVVFALIVSAVAGRPRPAYAPASAGFSSHPAALAERARVTAFFANPARIRAGGTTRLCYAVTGAHHLRLLPPTGTLTRLRTCLTVTLRVPRRYDYRLTALGDNGSVAVGHVHVDVSAGSGQVAAPRLLGKPAAFRAIRRFTAEPRVIAPGQSASVCAGVNHAVSAFLAPIGALRIGTTRCYRVRPLTTTVYRLTVAANHSVAVQTLTIGVRSAQRHR